MESDSQLVIQGLNQQNSVSYFDLIIQDIHVVAIPNISCFRFVKRSANSVDNSLARDAVFNAGLLLAEALE